MMETETTPQAITTGLAKSFGGPEHPDQIISAQMDYGMKDSYF